MPSAPSRSTVTQQPRSLHTNEEEHSLEYELRCCRDLPSIDLSKNVKHVLLSRASQQRLSRLLRHTRRYVTPAQWFGVGLGIASLFTSSPSFTSAFAFISLFGQIVPSVIVLLLLRYDLARLTLQTYEFWYITITSLMCLGMIAHALEDARGVSVTGTTVAFELALMVDANYRSARLTALLTLFGALVDTLFILCLSFRWLHLKPDLTIFRYRNRSLGADDVAINNLMTLVVLLLRNSIRKYATATHQYDKLSGTETTRCIAYHCCITMHPVRTIPTPFIRRSSSTIPRLPTVVPLEYVPVRETFPASNVLVPWIRPLLVRPSAQFLLPHALQLAGVLGVLTVPLAVFVRDPEATRRMSVFAFAMTLAHCGVYWMMAQRQLLHRLLTSFDFVFMSLQLTLCSVAICDLVAYDVRSLVVTSTWLWMHWVITLDAITPDMKTSLGYHRSLAGLVVVMFVAQNVLLVVHLVFVDSVTLRDRVIVTIPLHGNLKQLRVAPFLFGRMVTTLSWSGRLLWRLHDRAPDELFMLQGEVQFQSPQSAPLGMATVLPKPPST
ncbi:hypothetical protein Poli38472_001987 [Pythium oligandrum]|uniref:Transmembrane protein n=1 Tax=Pythium oligandrum TaxID=41045 RepID=A0A8K1CTZ7_PYTOL|nr:hypothetical protein Poli38472_001987 [Pythium oligandrum]|eukprot:TMW69831.1 hypothetical protein Poli38472_001987 [Pythium oligandrum]